ncbi:MAG TPA: rod shape-determining protein MreC [Alphaproteobacteria bacterium]|nr:rod shape-determining protein MreC [Alphaproteobacteria bacterium]
MKRPGPVSRFAAPLKLFAQRFNFLFLIAAAIGLMVLGKAETAVIERMRMVVTDAFVPILDAIARPVATVNQAMDRVNEVIHVHAENARLREENERLLQWQSVARKLEAENRSLRDMLRYTPEAPVSFVSARVVGHGGGSFVRAVLVTAGAKDGVAKGQAAMTGDGLVGRVSEVGDRSARVLLITDINSLVPVVLETSRDRAVLAGDNSERPKLLFLPPTAKPQIGERVTTSGHGGVFPAGLPIGVVVAAGEGGVRVQPFVDLDRLEHVRLVEYGLGGTLPVSAPPPAQRRGQR